MKQQILQAALDELRHAYFQMEAAEPGVDRMGARGRFLSMSRKVFDHDVYDIFPKKEGRSDRK